MNVLRLRVYVNLRRVQRVVISHPFSIRAPLLNAINPMLAGGAQHTFYDGNCVRPIRARLGYIVARVRRTAVNVPVRHIKYYSEEEREKTTRNSIQSIILRRRTRTEYIYTLIRVNFGF